MQLKGVHHVSINVSDAGAAERFYLEVLGLEKLDRPDFGFPGTWLGTPDGEQVHLIQVDNWVAPKGQHFSFRVEDLDGMRSHLQGRGVKVSEPNEIDGVCRQSFFKDPSGNLIEITQPVPAKAG
jgi:catechol 2,3-dioxygenase-like lactoylglutathione lyase family enzyme